MRSLGDIRRRREDGYTIIEVLVVLAIASLISISIVNTNPLSQGGLRSVSQQLKSLLVATRLAATSGRDVQTATFDVQQRVLRSTAYDEVVLVPMPLELTITSAAGELQTSRATVAFSPNGTSTGIEIIIKAPSGAHAVLRVDWQTGTPELVMDER